MYWSFFVLRSPPSCKKQARSFFFWGSLPLPLATDCQRSSAVESFKAPLAEAKRCHKASLWFLVSPSKNCWISWLPLLPKLSIFSSKDMGWLLPFSFPRFRAAGLFKALLLTFIALAKGFPFPIFESQSPLARPSFVFAILRCTNQIVEPKSSGGKKSMVSTQKKNNATFCSDIAAETGSPHMSSYDLIWGRGSSYEAIFASYEDFLPHMSYSALIWDHMSSYEAMWFWSCEWMHFFPCTGAVSCTSWLALLQGPRQNGWSFSEHPHVICRALLQGPRRPGWYFAEGTVIYKALLQGPRQNGWNFFEGSHVICKALLQGPNETWGIWNGFLEVFFKAQVQDQELFALCRATFLEPFCKAQTVAARSHLATEADLLFPLLLCWELLPSQLFGGWPLDLGQGPPAKSGDTKIEKQNINQWSLKQSWAILLPGARSCSWKEWKTEMKMKLLEKLALV